MRLQLSPRLALRQSQNLTMTPQLLQAIKLLTLSQLEIDAYITNELAQNPLLERAAEAGDGASLTERENGILYDARAAKSAPADVEAPAGAYEHSAKGEEPWLYPAPVSESSADVSLTLLSQQGDLHDSAVWEGVRAPSLAFMDGFLSDQPAPETSLCEHVARQIRMMVKAPNERLLAEHLAGFLDARGYFDGDIAQIANDLSVTPAMVEKALALVQQCEPVGVGARALPECLALQLKARGHYDAAFAVMLEHLPFVAARDEARLASLCGVSKQKIAAMTALLRTLDPKPGRAFGCDANITIVPDVVLRRAPNSGWRVEIVDSGAQRLVLNRSYARHFERGGSAKPLSAPDKSFLQKNMQNAHWLIKALEQRTQTILKVTREIVRQQQGFFDHGVGHFRPLTLRQVAERVGLHESTVSRVTTQKYLATPRGTFELKYFFSTALESSAGDGTHAAEVVKFKIRQLIASEDARSILSDDAIAAYLQRDNIVIARRTVAKYREMLAIPTSVERRRRARLARACSD